VFWQKEAKKTAVASRFNEAFVRKVENLIDMNLMGSSIGSGAGRLVIIKLRGSNSVFTFPPPNSSRGKSPNDHDNFAFMLMTLRSRGLARFASFDVKARRFFAHKEIDQSASRPRQGKLY
jgi:hypothetical protein